MLSAEQGALLALSGIGPRRVEQLRRVPSALPCLGKECTMCFQTSFEDLAVQVETLRFRLD